jgi:hypothetical protein
MFEHCHFSRLFGGAAVFAVTIFGLATGAQAQVTDAQRSAIRSSCRSDFMANCSSVTPGGAEAFQCLKRNEGKLSAACRSAVDAISAAEKPAATPAPAAAAAPAEEKPAAAKPAAASTPEKPAAAKPPAKPATASAAPAPSQPAKKQSSPPKATTAAVPAAPADTGPPPPPPPPDWTQIPPRFELQVVRSCRPEVRTICALPAGGGRILNCLATNQATVSAMCSAALDRARAAAVQ